MAWAFRMEWRVNGGNSVKYDEGFGTDAQNNVFDDLSFAGVWYKVQVVHHLSEIAYSGWMHRPSSSSSMERHAPLENGMQPSLGVHKEGGVRELKQLLTNTYLVIQHLIIMTILLYGEPFVTQVIGVAVTGRFHRQNQWIFYDWALHVNTTIPDFANRTASLPRASVPLTLYL